MKRRAQGRPQRRWRRLCLAAALALGGCAAEPTAPPPPPDPEPATEGRHSALWGKRGEAFREDGRLPDFSYAGYGMGEVPLPRPPAVANVQEFGAVGDGEADDTEAFHAAIAAAGEGAIDIPAGRYKITRPLEIRRSNLVLRGAGRDETVLYFPKPLFEVLGKGTEGGPSGWSWGGAWVRFHGEFQEAPALAKVTRPARRGERSVVVNRTDGLEPGQWVRLQQHETDGGLSLEIHAGHRFLRPCIIDFEGHRSMDWVVKITRVEGRRVHFDRPLRIGVRPEWQAQLAPFLPTVQEVGVEHLTVEFPPTLYPGHHKGRGYNAIEMRWTFNAWVRNVKVVNFDNAVFFWYARYATGRDLVLDGRGGHYGLSMGGSQDSLMTRFDVRVPSEHDLSVANLSNGCVFSRGRGAQLNFDHHRGAAYENLFSNLHVGEAWETRRLWWQSDTPSGHYAAARETFWNIKPRMKPQFLPLWPQMNIIGPVKSNRQLDPELERLDPWLERIKRPKPADLHAAQVARRLGERRP